MMAWSGSDFHWKRMLFLLMIYLDFAHIRDLILWNIAKCYDCWIQIPTTSKEWHKIRNPQITENGIWSTMLSIFTHGKYREHCALFERIIHHLLKMQSFSTKTLHFHAFLFIFDQPIDLCWLKNKICYVWIAALVFIVACFVTGVFDRRFLENSPFHIAVKFSLWIHFHLERVESICSHRYCLSPLISFFI